jgi:hypothetical protein
MAQSVIGNPAYAGLDAASQKNWQWVQDNGSNYNLTPLGQQINGTNLPTIYNNFNQPPSTTTTGGASSGGDASGSGSSSSLYPSSIFNSKQTADAKSQIYAQAGQAANTQNLLKSYYQPSSGTSIGPAQLGRIAPIAGNISAGGLNSANNLTLSDAYANANQQLQGANNTMNYALGAGSLGQQQQNLAFNQGLNQQQQGNALLGQLMGPSGLIGGLFSGLV